MLKGLTASGTVHRHTGWRDYVAALALLVVVLLVRLQLVPLLGKQSPLLAFILPVLVASFLWGRGPAIVVGLGAPLLVTPVFHPQFEWAAPLGWLAHVVFFLLISAGAIVLIDQMQRARRELARSEKRFRQLADAMPQIVYVLAPDRTVQYVNRQWREYTGSDVAAEPALREIIPEEDLRALYAAWAEHSPKHQPYSSEFRMRSQTGELRWFLRRAAPIVGDNGEVEMWVGTSTDIHEQKLTEEALREADRRKDEFLAMLAHELRNPLAPIMNISSILDSRAVADPMVQQMSGILKRQTMHLARMVDDLLDVSRITRGTIRLQPALLALQQVVERAVEGVQPLLNAKKQTVDQVLPSAPAMVEGDLVRLTQVLGNLLTNASKFSPEGSRLHLLLEVEESEAHLHVRDPGIGMDPASLPRIFDLFMQADQSLDRSQSGLGIGLTIAKRLVELHGGRIEARSEGVGQGSEFIVTLPLIRAKD
ncbi:MAG: ATP-binding protein [Povalibacter sp.]